MAGRPSPPRVRVAAIIVRDEMLLMVQHAKNGRSYWMLPGGGVDMGESLEAALIRELREETKTRIAPGELVFVNDSIDPNGGRHIVNLFFAANIVSGEPALGMDSRVVDVAFIPFEALDRIAMFPAIAPELGAFLRGERGPVYIGNRWNP